MMLPNRGQIDKQCIKTGLEVGKIMRGLLIKDFFCLKKQLINYGFVIVGVIVISILFVLSYNFGNIHAQFVELVTSGESTEAGVTMIASNALLLFMLIPIACTGDITNLITDDEKASFYKVASVLPISISKRVACRFITGYLFIAIGVAVDLLMSIVISSLTGVISFPKFCGVIISFASLMMMYVSLFLLLVYVLGKGKTSYASVIPLLAGVALYGWVNFERLRAFLIDSDDNAFMEVFQRTTEFIFFKSYLLLIAAVIISVGAYLAAVSIAKKKRGVA